MKDLKLTEEEQKVIEEKRKEHESFQKCSKEVNAVLEKYKYQLVVNPNSSLNNPEIILIKK